MTGKSSPAVGRGKPPVQHRFKPGQSGNPKGRPRKALPSGKINPLEQAIADAIMAEGQRPITITEGGKQRILTASQAVIRSTYVAAMKGSANAQRTLIQTLLQLEQRTRTEHAEAFRSGLLLKNKLEAGLAEWVASGRCEKDLRVHPDDIEIDPETLDVRIHVPLTSEQAERQADVLRARDDLLEQIQRAEATLAEEGDNELVQLGLKYAQERLPRFNDALPPRLRRD